MRKKRLTVLLTSILVFTGCNSTEEVPVMQGFEQVASLSTSQVTSLSTSLSISQATSEETTFVTEFDIQAALEIGSPEWWASKRDQVNKLLAAITIQKEKLNDIYKEWKAETDQAKRKDLYDRYQKYKQYIKENTEKLNTIKSTCNTEATHEGKKRLTLEDIMEGKWYDGAAGEEPPKSSLPGSVPSPVKEPTDTPSDGTQPGQTTGPQETTGPEQTTGDQQTGQPGSGAGGQQTGPEQTTGDQQTGQPGSGAGGGGGGTKGETSNDAAWDMPEEYYSDADTTRPIRIDPKMPDTIVVGIPLVSDEDLSLLAEDLVNHAFVVDIDTSFYITLDTKHLSGTFDSGYVDEEMRSNVFKVYEQVSSKVGQNTIILLDKAYNVYWDIKDSQVRMISLNSSDEKPNIVIGDMALAVVASDLFYTVNFDDERSSMHLTWGGTDGLYLWYQAMFADDSTMPKWQSPYGGTVDTISDDTSRLDEIKKKLEVIRNAKNSRRR